MQNIYSSIKLSLLILCVGITGGCAVRAMDAAIVSWHGQQVSAVTADWGPPSEKLTLEGKQLLIWHTYDGKTAPPDAKVPVITPGSKYCDRLLHADKNGRIFDGTWDGNDCPGWLSGWIR